MLARQPRRKGEIMSRQEPPADDLSRIDGIGTTTAGQLHELGYRTFQQLADASVDEIVAGSEGRGRISRQRILKEGWLEQAARLAEEEAGDPGPDDGDPEHPGRRTFTVELRIDPVSGEVVAAKAVDVDSEQSQAWPGWNPGRLIDFIGARLASTGTSVQDAAVTSPSGPDHEGGGGGVHRFGVLDAEGEWPPAHPITAALELDPAELELKQQAAVLVQVCARQPGLQYPQLLAEYRRSLRPDRPFRAELDAVLPPGAGPVKVFATVRIVVDHPPEKPSVGLGTAKLTLQPA
jgi:Helix-hairpin-helix domain